jgi:hypothetical protein
MSFASPCAVSQKTRAAELDALTQHLTIGGVDYAADGRATLACSCGMVLTNGPTWSLDEHIRLHRAEAGFLALSAAAPAGVPRLVTLPAGPVRLVA